MALLIRNGTFLFIFLFALQILHHADAQPRLNFGLTKKQPTNTLPKGKASDDQPVRKGKIAVSTQPQPVGQHTYGLNKGWQLADGETVITSGQMPTSADINTSHWYNATVPGTVLTTLVNEGVYPDPYIGLNNLAIPDTLSRKDWWYRLSFDAPKVEQGKLAWLQFNGINYRAQVWLNNTLLGTIDGAFIRGLFDVTRLLLKDKKNILAVHVFPPNNPGIPHEQSFLSGMGPNGGQLCLDGPTFISSEGWDWVPGIRDRNIGIWQDVQLKYSGAITIHDPQVITDLPLPDTSLAYLTVKTILINHSNTSQNVDLEGTIKGVHFSAPVSLAPNEEKLVELNPKTTASLVLKNPKLWWPNRYGNPSLYNMHLQVVDNANVSDESDVRFGVREFSYELMADAPQQKGWRFEYSPTDINPKIPLLDNVKRREVETRIFIPSIREDVNTSGFKTLPDTSNPYLVVKVNGVKIFCRGGNWGMDDAMKRSTKERLEPAFKLDREAGFNMIRNWTGESTEEIFYDLADEYGMLVWNDFWISTEGYNLNPNDQQLWLNNSLDVIKRFRNHPSIAVWCPRNEGYAPVGIENELANQIAVEDGTRHYIGNSREINLRPSGDWHYIEDYNQYFIKYAEGFSTEIGTFSVPVASTIRKFIKPEDQWPIDDVWHYHDLHSNNQNLPGYLKAVDSLYGKATSLDDFNRKVQLINYETHRAIFEAWNSKQWKNTSGVLLWMTHPAWPSMIWQTYSWDYETHGSYYGAKKACEPVHIQLNLNDSKVVVSNASLKNYSNAKAVLNVYDLQGATMFTKTEIVNVSADQATEVFTPDLSSLRSSSIYLIRLQLKDCKGAIISENNYWKTNKDFTAFNALKTVDLKIKVIKISKDAAVIGLQNPSSVPAIGIKLNVTDDANAVLLPAYFSDGYFTLLPNEEKTITIEYPETLSVRRIKTGGYNVPVNYFKIN